MSISLISQATWGVNTNTATLYDVVVPHPTGMAVGDLIVGTYVLKTASASAQGGGTGYPVFLTGSTVTSANGAGYAADAGDVSTGMLWRIVDGTEPTTSTWQINGGTTGNTGNNLILQFLCFRSTTGFTASSLTALTFAAQSTSSPSWSGAGTSDIAPGDLIVGGIGYMSDAPSVTAAGLSATGVTFNTPTLLTKGTGTSGSDLGGNMWWTTVASGTATAATVTGTATLSATAYGSHTALRISPTAAGPAPTVTSLSPSTGSTSGGTSVTITGTNLTGATSVMFGTNAATSVVVNSSTSISCVSPAGSAGTVNVTVTTANGTSATGSGNVYTYAAYLFLTATASTTSALTATGKELLTATPATTSSISTTIAKATGYTELRSVTANTGGLLAGTPTATANPGPSNNGWIWDATSLEGQQLSAGTYNVSIRVQASSTSISSAFYVRLFKRSSSGSFTSIGMATIATGALATTATIKTGSFTTGSTTPFSAGDKLYMDVIASVTTNGANNSASTITLSRGTVDDSVVLPGYTATPPAITSLGLSAVPVAGGTTIGVNGTDFTGATAVTVGGTPATSFTVNGSTSITMVTPAKAAGTYDVIVTTPAGTSPNTSADDLTYVVAPTITAVSPTVINTGDLVTLTGTGFSTATAVAHQTGSVGSFTIVNDTTITLTATNFRRSGSMKVTNPGGNSGTTWTLANAYTYYWALQNNFEGGTSGTAITTGNSGGSSGDAFTTIFGPPTYTNLAAAHGTLSAKPSATSSFQLSVDPGVDRWIYYRFYLYLVATPTSTVGLSNHAIGSYTLNTSTGSGLSITTSRTITQFVVGGNNPAATGALSLATWYRVEYDVELTDASTGTSQLRVYVGDSTTATYTVSSSNWDAQLVYNLNFLSASATDMYFDDIAVSNISQPGVAVLSVDSLSSTSGSASGGDSVTITGVNFLEATAVKFGTVNATSYTVNSATSITAITPAQTSGTVATVSVTNPPYGTANGPSYTYGTAAVTRIRRVGKYT